MTCLRQKTLWTREHSLSKSNEQSCMRTAYDDFLDIIRKFRGLSVTALGMGGAVPFFAYVARIAPPWPPGIMLVTALTEIVCLIVVFQFLRSKRKLITASSPPSRCCCLASLGYFLLAILHTLRLIRTSDSLKGSYVGRKYKKVLCRSCPFVARYPLGLQYTARTS